MRLFELDHGDTRRPFAVDARAELRHVLHGAQVIADALFELARAHAVDDLDLFQPREHGLPSHRPII